METLSERELLAPPAAPQSRTWPWTPLVEKIHAKHNKLKAASRRRRFRNALSFFRVGVAAWRSAASISPEDRVRLQDRFRNARRAEYRRRFVNRRLGVLFQAGLLLCSIAYFAVLPLVLPEKYRAGDYFDTLFLGLDASLLVIIIGGLVIYWVLKYLNGWAITETARTANRGAGIGLLILIPIFYVVVQASGDPLLVVLLGLMSWGVVLGALFGVTWVALSVATNWVRWRNPDALLAVALFSAMRDLEFHPDRWPDPEFRAGIARELGGASKIVRSFLFRRFEPADPATRFWQLRQADRIADGLAHKQRWLITPKPDTYGFLLGALSHCLVAVLSGTWDELARREASEASEAQDAASGPDMSRGRRAVAILLGGLQTIAVAALPAAALWMARSRDLLTHVDSGTLDYVEIGVFVWAVLILAFMLDPRLRDKIAGVKDVISLLNPGKKGSN